MLLLRIERQSPEPIYRQIARRIAELIETDVLRPDAVLPPTRALAHSLGISRFTVAQAYEELWAQGYTKSRQGSHTQVRARPKRGRPAIRNVSDASPIRTSRAAGSLLAHQRNAVLPPRPLPGVIDFSSLQVDPKLIPTDALRQQFAKVLRREQAALCNYADPAGYYPLRQFIASRMQRHGAELSPEEVLVTHGSQQGLALLFRLLVNSNDLVAIERPTFSGVIGLLQMHGAKALEIPMLSYGMDLDVLEHHLRRRARRSRLKLVYTIPAFHNPTGITTSQPHRERLLEICEQFRLPLVEDGFQEEFSFFDKVVQPIKSMDRRGIVLYLGSFSKVFVPGLRLGWIAAHRGLIAQLALLKCATDISCSPIVQAALHGYCASGAYEVHLRRMNRVMSSRLRRAVDVLHQELPQDRVELQSPSGGYLIWLLVDAKATEAGLVEALAKHQVAASPGGLFYSGRAPRLALRLSISSLNDQDIAEGAKRLGRALRGLPR